MISRRVRTDVGADNHFLININIVTKRAIHVNNSLHKIHYLPSVGGLIKQENWMEQTSCLIFKKCFDYSGLWQLQLINQKHYLF